MISVVVLTISLLLILLIAGVVVRSVLLRQPIMGRPPVPVVFFLLAKMLVIVNLVFLLMKGLDIHVVRLFPPVLAVDILALVLLVTGSVILFLSTFRLKNDLVFGLSSSDSHRLQTGGVYSISRHPFYLGFLCILFSSTLFNPNWLNILAFAGAWTIHHFIMVREEAFLVTRYGDEYLRYKKRVHRYISL